MIPDKQKEARKGKNRKRDTEKKDKGSILNFITRKGIISGVRKAKIDEVLEK